MAIKGLATIDEVTIYRVDADPTTAGGITADIGDWAILDDDINAGLWFKKGALDTDWVKAPDFDELIASNIVFNPTGTTFRATSTDVDKVLKELHLKDVKEPEETTTTLNGTLTLDNTSNTLQIILGTATGYTLQLPNATTIPVGSSYKIANNSSESISINDGSGTFLLTLNSGDVVEAILEADGTSAGSWITIITSGSATGIVSYVVTGNALFSTSSSLDDLITNFSVTPVSGRYSVFFSADGTISSNNRLAECVVYVDGVANENTRREFQGVSSNFNTTLSTIGEVTVNGSQVVDIRVNISSNTLSINQRSLILIRLGGA